mgnify:CR=1 FL=1
MLSRKIEKDIINWLENENKALLIDGARQVGKTYIVKEFGKQYYENVIYLNFETNNIETLEIVLTDIVTKTKYEINKMM